MAAGEVMEIKTKKEIPTTGLGKYFWGGKQVIKKEMPELAPLDKNPADYDLIFLGTPVWAGNFAPAIRSFLLQVKLKNKTVAFFCAHGGDNPGQTFVNLEKELAGNMIVGKIDFKMNMISSEEERKNLEQAAKWASRIVDK